jgi:hypothetical protein
MKWFRLYSSVLHDPKVQRLTPALFKHWVNLLCLASEQDDRGMLPSLDDIAFALRIKPSEATQVMTQLRGAALRCVQCLHTLAAYLARHHSTARCAGG